MTNLHGSAKTTPRTGNVTAATGAKCANSGTVIHRQGRHHRTRTRIMDTNDTSEEAKQRVDKNGLPKNATEGPRETEKEARSTTSSTQKRKNQAKKKESSTKKTVAHRRGASAVDAGANLGRDQDPGGQAIPDQPSDHKAESDKYRIRDEGLPVFYIGAG